MYVQITFKLYKNMAWPHRAFSYDETQLDSYMPLFHGGMDGSWTLWNYTTLRDEVQRDQTRFDEVQLPCHTEPTACKHPVAVALHENVFCGLAITSAPLLSATRQATNIFCAA